MCVRRRDTIKAQVKVGVQPCGFLSHFHTRGDLNVPLAKLPDFYSIAIFLLQFQLD